MRQGWRVATLRRLDAPARFIPARPECTSLHDRGNKAACGCRKSRSNELECAPAVRRGNVHAWLELSRLRRGWRCRTSMRPTILPFWLRAQRSRMREDVVQDAYLRAFRAYRPVRWRRHPAVASDHRPKRRLSLAVGRASATANVVSIEDALRRGGNEAAGASRPASAEPSAEDVLIGDGRSATGAAARWPSSRRHFARSSCCGRSRGCPIRTLPASTGIPDRNGDVAAVAGPRPAQGPADAD